jgi:hypothetical protein
MGVRQPHTLAFSSQIALQVYLTGKSSKNILNSLDYSIDVIIIDTVR